MLISAEHTAPKEIIEGDPWGKPCIVVLGRTQMYYFGFTECVSGGMYIFFCVNGFLYLTRSPHHRGPAEVRGRRDDQRHVCAAVVRGGPAHEDG